MKIPPDKNHFIKELEQEKLLLEQLNKYLEENESISDEVFDSVSHDLRTPVSTIKAYTDMLLQGHFGDLTSKQKEKMKQIKENTDLLINVIFQMLDKSKKRR